MKKRLVAFLLVLIMVLGMLPVSALAADDGISPQALNTGHKIDVTFTVLYVGDEFNIGYNYGASEKTQFVCQYTEPHSDTAYNNHTIAISDIKAAADRASVNSGYQIVGWSKEANENPTVWPLNKAGTTACNKGTSIYLVAKNPNPNPNPTYMYYLYYKYNDGTNSTWLTEQSGEHGTAATTFTFYVNTAKLKDRRGYEHIGWADKANAAAAKYTGGESITLTKDDPTKTIYAVWMPFFELKYDANGGTGAPASQTRTASAPTVNRVTFTVPGTIPTKDGCTFKGWADSSTATTAQYQPGGPIAVKHENSPKTVYAVWEESAPQPPLIPVPSYDDLKSAIGKIQVKDVSTPSCGTENYDLIDNTQSEPFNWTKTARLDQPGKYDVTIKTAPYVAKYNSEKSKTHELNNANQTTLKLVISYENNTWKLDDGLRVIEVKHSEQTPPTDKPEKPTENDVTGVVVDIVCVTTTGTHDTVQYPLGHPTDAQHTIGEVVSDGAGGYICPVTVRTAWFVQQASNLRWKVQHTPTAQTITFNLTYDKNSKTWVKPAANPRIEATHEVTPPTKPTALDGSFAIVCKNNKATHGHKADYIATPRQYTISDVQMDNQGYYVTATVTVAPNLAAYNALTGVEHRLVNEQNATLTLTFRYNTEVTGDDENRKWKQQGDLPVVEVICKVIEAPTRDDIFKALNGLVTVTCINRFWKDGNNNMDCGQGQYAAKAGIAGQEYTLEKGEDDTTWVVTFPVTNFVKSFKQNPAHHLYTGDTLSWYIRWEDNAWTSAPVKPGVDDLVKLTHAPTDWREVAKIATGGKSDCIHTSCVNGKTGVCDYGITVPFVYFNTDVVSVEPEAGVRGSYIATFKVNRYIDTCAKACNDKNFKDAPRTLKLLTQDTVQWRLYATPEADEKIGNNVPNHVWEAEPVKAGKDDVCTIAHNWVVTFNPDNGGDTFKQNVEYEGKAIKPTPDPEKTGYTFDGWYLDEAEAPFSFDTTITSDITLKAKWNINKYTVTFNSYGGTPVPPAQEVEYGHTATKPADPTLKGYTFAFWYLGEDEQNATAYDFDTPVTENITLTAKWNINKYTVAFNTDGGTPVPPAQEVEYGLTATEPAAPEKTGYTFDGWYLGDEKYDFSAAVEQNITLTAKWEAKKANVHLMIFKSGDLSKPIVDVPYAADKLAGDTIDLTKIDPSSYLDFDFEIDGGWYDDGMFNSYKRYLDGLQDKPAGLEKLLITGNWQNLKLIVTELVPVVYFDSLESLTAYQNDHSKTEGILHTTKARVGSALPTADAPTATRDGYTFTFWSREGQTVDVTDQTVNGWTNLYANWEKKTFTVKYYLPDETGAWVEKKMDTVDSVDYATYSLWTPNAEDGYEFSGWYQKTADIGVKAKVEKLYMAKEWKLYGKFTPIEYTIQYVYNDGKATSTNPTTYTVESDTITLADATGADWGKTFLEWHDENGQKITEIPTGSTGNRVITAYWNWPVHLHYLDKDNNEIDSATLYVSELEPGACVLPTGEKTGYDFDGWYEAKKDIGTASHKLNALSIAKKWELYGRYTAKTDVSYTVKYLREGDNKVLAPEKVVTDQTFDTEVTEQAADVVGYTPDAPSKTMILDEYNKVLTFSYSAKTDVSYTVRYLREGDDKVLAPEKVVTDQTFDTEVTENAADVIGYTPDAPSKTMILDEYNKVLTFSYSAKTDVSYTVRYLREGDDKVLAPEKVVTDQTFDTEVTENAADVIGYTPDAPSKTMILDEYNKVLTFSYSANTYHYEVHYFLQAPDGSYMEKEVDKTPTGVFDTTVTITPDPNRYGAHYSYNSGKSTVSGVVTVDDPTTILKLYVYYDLDFHTLTFDTMGGSKIAPETVRHGLTVAKPKDPVNGGYIFDGWYTDKTFRHRYDFSTPLTEDITIYAKWFLIVLPGVTVKKNTPKLNTADHFAYVQGYPDGTVKPAGNITRAETAAILFRLMDDASRKTYYSTKSGFRDVASGSWYNTYVATLNNAGVITDSSNGYFRPNEAITRAELAAMLAKFSETTGAANYFNDVSAKYWAANAIAICAKLGWITGYPDGTFRPDKNVTRAELMAMINRATGRAPKSADAFLPGMKTWIDNTSDKWYYLDVQEATNSHSYTVKGSETWTALTSAPNWSLYE